ncbi:hypothetical protein F4212_00255 [Candidatus Poribacteria bacterium]|nr:hypothetical protein [Candidatus Poribacteria bacterium]
MTLTPRLGDHSWFAIARQTDSQTPITDVTKFIQYRYPFTSLGLDLESELQASEAIAGRRSDTRDQQGQLWGSGTIETQLYIDKMDEFWRGIINSGAPKATAVADTEVYTNTTFAKTITDPTTAPTTPGQIEIALVSTDTTDHALPADADLGTVDVFGQRRVGLESDALLPMKETGLAFTGGVATTSKYFARVDKVVFNVPEATTINAATTTTTITAKPGQNASVFKNNDAIFPGWTMQLVRGNVPAVAEGAVPVNATLTIAENIRLQMEILARKMHPNRQVGSDTETFKITNALSKKPFITDVFYPNWGGLLEVEGECLIFTNLSLNINQNLDFLPGVKASRYRLPVAPTGERRNVTLTTTVYYEVDETTGEMWSQVFCDNVPRSLKASCYYWNEEGKQFSQSFSLPVGYLTASPRIGVDSRGPITRELAFKGVPSSDTDPDEIAVEVVV